MGRRKSNRKPPPKRKAIVPLDLQFDCPFCNHEKACEVQMLDFGIMEAHGSSAAAYAMPAADTGSYKARICIHFSGQQIGQALAEVRDRPEIWSNFLPGDKERKTARITCRICSEDYQTSINALSEALDVYNDWIDACEATNN